jgi:hypothetical protein
MPLAQRFAVILRPDLLAAGTRFPVPAAAALLATVLIILRVEEVIPPGSDPYERVLSGAGTAFAAGVALGIWLDGRGRPAALAGQLAALAVGVGAGLALYSLWLTPAMLLAALALLTIAAPGFAAGGTPIRCWTFNIRSAFAALVGAVGAGVFVLGFWAILATLGKLFDLSISYRLVSHAGTVGFVFVLPLYWLAFQPRVQELGPDEPPPDILLRAVAVLTDFIFLPLLVAYAAILHAYAAKIAINAVLPRGQIGWMVSIFVGLGYLAFQLATSRQSPLPRLRQFFRRAWPPATLVPAGLLILALRERVQAYGMTEDRYVLAVIAVGAVMLILAWVPKRQLDPRLVPAVAAGLLLIGAFGPIAARLVTVRSQAQRLVSVLEASGELSNGTFEGKRSTPWGQETRRDLQTIITLLEQRRALHLIAPVIGAELAANPKEFRARLGLDGLGVARPPSPTISAYVRIDSDILFGRFVSSEIASRAIVFRAPQGPDYTLKGEGQRLVLSGPEGTFSFDLSAAAARQQAPEVGFTSEATPPPPLVRADDPRAVLILRVLQWDGSGDARRFGRLSGEILLRRVQP